MTPRPAALAAPSLPVGTKWAEVEAAALTDNTDALRGHAGEGCRLMAMVKANGYGHGAITAATAAIAGGATWLGVSSIGEAVELRRGGLTEPILNIGWTAPAEMHTAVAHDIDVAVFDSASVAAAAAAAAAAGRQVRVHWKIDSGMGRLGTPESELEAMHGALVAAGLDVVVVALFTHFASADDASTDFTIEQHRRFLAAVARVRDSFPAALLHCANSAALLRLPETHHDIIRPGIALYGYLPAHCEGIVAVRPALSMRALVTQVKHVEPGSSVGYGRDWFATSRTRVATVAAGYADGVDRRNSNRGRVVVGGAICPVIGRVSMDQLTVNISDASEVQPGDTATLIGDVGGLVIDAAGVAGSIGTIANEVLCAISSRVPRVAVGTQVGSP